MKNDRSYWTQRKLRQCRGEGSCSPTKLSLSRGAEEVTQSWDLEIKPEIGNWTSCWLAAPTHREGLRGRGQGLGLLNPHVGEGGGAATGLCSGAPEGLTQFLMRLCPACSWEPGPLPLQAGLEALSEICQRHRISLVISEPLSYKNHGARRLTY